MSAGMSRETGALLTDWDHVVQSLGDIFTTGFGERVMRRYYGSLVPRLLGENLTVATVLRFYAALGTALVQEPRVALTQVRPLAVTRAGQASFEIEFQYRPRALAGDFTAAGARKVTASVIGSQLQVLA